jgi:pyruvate/2-oxoglutarate dehydrogenase complex dihydrolipoamide acyltransferase (E2) component
MPDFDILQFPPGRQVIVDAGYLGAKRHIIYGLAEVDVTLAFDHDLVDGAPAARFAHTFIELVEKAEALQDD